MTTMKALVKKQARPGLWLDDVPLPQIGINDVLIRVDRTGICGTDLHIYNWDAWAQKTIPVPLVTGHEFVGEIIEVGSNVKDFHAGEVVSGEGHVVCGHCRNCLAGRRHLCKDTKGVGVNRPGAFAEYLALPMSNVCHGGKIALLGIPGENIAIDWTTVVFNGLTLKGIYGREMYETWYKMTVMIQSGLDITPVITHHFPYTKYEQAFAVARSGQS